MQSDFLYLLENELAGEREQDPQPIAAKWQAYGMVSGGLSRLLDELQSPSLDPKAGMLARLLDIAAMCYRAAEDLQLLEAPEYEPAHEWCKEHKGLRFRADDPNQEKLGMAINYKCLHGVEWTVTGECLDALRLSQFNHCDCFPVRIPAILKDGPLQVCNTAQEEDYYRELRLKSAYKEGEI